MGLIRVIKKIDGFFQNSVAVFISILLILGAYYVAAPSDIAYSAACSTFNGNETTCQTTYGCTWDSQSCSAFNENQVDCGNTNGCTWNNGDCSALIDEATCVVFGCSSSYSNCTWNGSSCDGGGSCSGIGDQFSCEQGTYYSSCSGTYTAYCSGTNYPGTCSGTYDDTPPTLSSATVVNTTVTLAYNEPMDTGSIPSTSRFAVTVGGVSATLTSVGVSGSNVTITLTNNVGYGSAVVLSYTPGASPIQDVTGNDAASISNQSVTNNTQNIPTISITAPTSGDILTGSSVSFTATASANGGASLEGVKFYIDSTLIGSEDTSSPYAITLDSTLYSDGSHTLYAAARNSINGYATSSVALYIDQLVWTTQTGAGSRIWQSITSSSDGSKLAAVVNGGYIYTSTDSGATWTARTGAGSRNWLIITSSSDGSKLAAVVNGGYIYTSADSGATWTARTGAGSRNWYSITSSSDGSKLAAAAINNYLYTSTDSGSNWTQRIGGGSKNWNNITSSSDGIKLAATVINSYIYTTTYDITAPSAPGTPDMTSGTDSGSSSTDNTTSDTTPTFDISCETDATVTLKESNTTLGTGTCASSTVSITSSALSEASHSITAIQTDTSNNVSATSSALSITIDATAPSISSIASSTTQTTATIAWTTDEAATSTANYGLTTSYGTASSSQSTTTAHSINLTGLTASTLYHYQVASTDVAGNITTSSDKTFTTAAVANQGGGVTDTQLNTNASTGGGGGGYTTIMYPNTTFNSTFASSTTNIIPLPPYINKTTISDVVRVNNQIIVNFSNTIFTRNLTILSQNNEVKELQKLLNTLGFTLATKGPGSRGNETNKFGSLTRESLKSFQRSVGITPAAGYFGPITRQYVNNLIKTIKANKNFPGGR